MRSHKAAGGYPTRRANLGQPGVPWHHKEARELRLESAMRTHNKPCRLAMQAQTANPLKPA